MSKFATAFFEAFSNAKLRKLLKDRSVSRGTRNAAYTVLLKRKHKSR